ncbi:DUF397 domain-containing protein [Amycolatopsis thailandensis]|uniref:DUF397 domain-containing protein n=1 Tax=Amycolatopsis thailandensis TaxID=589330 RepID=A0A229S497_9PSEU|nr:DUF397 domain-containing protein [Amycolatopsis thailandensis]OXM53710.1 DUF397 domain-containing protein [Amycolatopsis thailandensis]
MTDINQEHRDDNDGRARWVRSSYSTPHHNCVELLILRSGVRVRDSKDPRGETLEFGSEAWTALLARIMR